MNPGTLDPASLHRAAPAPLVTFTRGGLDESIHFGSIAVVDDRGLLVAHAGDPHRPTTMRSTAKPFQAMVVVETGAADRFAMTPTEIAVIGASHSGEPRHCQAVAGLLQRAGLGPEDLQCGTHLPLHAPSRAALEQRGEQPSTLHHNCSGKHCGMLCACVHQDWDVHTYLRPDHPLQRQVLRLVSDCTGVPAQSIGIATDGCGVPTFAVPLAAIALAFARLTPSSHAVGGHAAAAARVASAMVAHPEMVAGEDRFDTDLMVLGQARLLAKAGAEACYGVSLLDRGWGMAIKIEDGNARAVPVAVSEALRQLGALADAEVAALARHARPVLRNYRGEIVGDARPSFLLERS